MRVTTGAIYGTVAVVLVVSVVSGPLVGAVDFSYQRGLENIGEGNITVSGVDAPETARIDQGFQSKNYYLKVPDATIHVAEMSGRPLVEYSITIPGLDLTRSTTHFLNGEQEGAVSLSLTRRSFAPWEIDETRYNGTLKLVARYSGTERTLYEGPITVEVTE